MNKKLILLLSAAFLMGGLNLNLAAQAVSGPFGYDLQQDINRQKSQPKKWETDKPKSSSSSNANSSKAQASEDTEVDDESIFLEKYEANPKYYPNASTKSAIAKYKTGNYTGSLQELYAILKKDSANATAYYYLAMVYTKLGETDSAKACYQRVINLNPNDMLVNYATRGQACLNNEAACNPENDSVGGTGEALDELDKFIQQPFGTGFSKELNDQLRNKQLQNIQNKMNRGEPLSEQDLQKLREYNKSEALTTDKLAMADDMPSNDEILNAVRVLKRAGLNISTQVPDSMEGNATSTPAKIQDTTAQKPAAVQPANYYTPDPQIQQMSMMLNNGNGNNNDPMMNMIPYMMQSDGKNMNPQVIQSMMMNSMMNSLNGMNTNNNNN